MECDGRRVVAPAPGAAEQAMHACVLFLIFLRCQATPPSGQVAPRSADAAPVARVNGEDLPLDDFRDWLVRTHGWRHVDDYVDLALLKQEARRAGIALPTAAELEAAFTEDWNASILLRHRGDESKFLKELADVGIDRQGWRDRRFGTIEQELLAKRILQARPMTEAQVKELYAVEFGADGTRTHVRVAFFDKLKSVRPGQQVEPELAEKLDAESKAAADAFLQAVRADRGRFASLVASTDLVTINRFDSFPIDLRSQGGDIPRLHHDAFGGSLEEALKDAKSGDLVGPVRTAAGCYVVEVIERSPAPFEKVQDELKEIWRTRAPSGGEVVWLKQELRKTATIERKPLAK
jgi:hypothetical protein